MATPLPEPQARRLAERTDKLLARLDKEQTRALIAELRRARRDILALLKTARLTPLYVNDAFQGYSWEVRRLDELFAQIDITIADLGRRLANVVILHPERAAGLADRYAADILQVKIIGSFGVLNRPALVALQAYNLELIKNVTDDVRAQVRSAVMQGVIQGEGIPQISRRLTTDTALTRGVFPSVERRARVISRTETIRAFSQGVQWQFRQNGITRVRWMTGRDERVCEWCGPLDGLVFTLDDLPYGGPPIHPQCRCFIRPIIAANTEEGKVLDLEAARNAKEQRKRFEEYQAKRKKRKGAA